MRPMIGTLDVQTAVCHVTLTLGFVRSNVPRVSLTFDLRANVRPVPVNFEVNLETLSAIWAFRLLASEAWLS